MVNAGALVTSDLVRGANADEKLRRMVAAMRYCAGNEDLDVDQDTFRAEMEMSDRNRAIAYLMRSERMLDGDVEAILALYLQQCSVHVTCRDLALMGATLANGCVNPLTDQSAYPVVRHARDLLSVMYTCGMYDFAGQWAFEVGFPAKSSVNGGILAVIPGKGGIGVYSPGLDAFGNSVRGIHVCREVSERMGLHVFAADVEDVMLRPRKPAG